MQLSEYQRAIARIPFGKRLPTAIYVIRDGATSLGEELDRLIGQVIRILTEGNKAHEEMPLFTSLASVKPHSRRCNEAFSRNFGSIQ